MSEASVVSLDFGPRLFNYTFKPIETALDVPMAWGQHCSLTEIDLRIAIPLFVVCNVWSLLSESVWDVLRLIRRCFTENNNGQHLSASLVLGRLYTPLTQFNCLGWNLSGTERFIRLGSHVKTWQLRCRQERESFSDVTSNQSEAAPGIWKIYWMPFGVSLITIPVIALAKTANLLSMSVDY